MQQEKKFHLKSPAAYNKFIIGVQKIKKSLVTLLSEIHAKGQTVIGVGSPAKAVVLLNFLGIDKTLIPVVTDTTPYKQNKYMPGTHIPILSETYIAKHVPDYFFLLAWTYRETLVRKLRAYKKAKIIIPLPKIETIT